MFFYLQEIYPPKLSEFAYVTDGACTENEILGEELLMLKVTNHSMVFFMNKVFRLLCHFTLSTHNFMHLSTGFKLEFITDHSQLLVKYLFTVVLLRK